MSIPPLPFDTRTVAYAPTAASTDFDVPFPVFGDGSDIEVDVNGMILNYGPDYKILSHSKPFGSIPSPVLDAFIRLTTAASGSVILTGNMRSRRTTQATASFTVDDFNRAQTSAVANLQEHRRDLEDVKSNVDLVLASIEANGAPFSAQALLAQLGVTNNQFPYCNAGTWVARDFSDQVFAELAADLEVDDGLTVAFQSGQRSATFDTAEATIYRWARYRNKYTTDDSALRHLLVDVHNDSGTRYVDGGGATVTLTVPRHVADDALVTTDNNSLFFMNFNFKADPTFPGTAFAATILNCVTTQGSATFTCSNTAGLLNGQMVEGSANLVFGSRIVSFVANTSVTIDNPALYSGTITVNFYKFINGTTSLGLPDKGSPLVTAITSTVGLKTGMRLRSPALARESYILTVDIPITLSQNATLTQTGVALTINGVTFPNCDTTVGFTSAMVHANAAGAVTAGVVTGPGIPTTTSCTVAASTQITMTQNAIAASTSGTAGGRIAIADDPFMLDYTGFTSLRRTQFINCQFDGNNVANCFKAGVNNQSTHFLGCWFIGYEYYAIQFWNTDGGGNTVDFCEGIQNLAGIQPRTRVPVFISMIAGDAKIRGNRATYNRHALISNGNGTVLANNHFFAGMVDLGVSDPTSGDAAILNANIVLQQSSYGLIVGNYIDHGWIELTDEKQAFKVSNPSSLGGIIIVGNRFVTGQNSTTNFVFVKVKGFAVSAPSTIIQDIVAVGNLFVQTSGSGRLRVFGVDTTLVTPDLTQTSGLIVRDNSFGAGFWVTANPVACRFHEANSNANHTIDVTNILPFNCSPNSVRQLNVFNPSAAAYAYAASITPGATPSVTITTSAAITGDIDFTLDANTYATGNQTSNNYGSLPARALFVLM